MRHNCIIILSKASVTRARATEDASLSVTRARATTGTATVSVTPKHHDDKLTIRQGPLLRPTQVCSWRESPPNILPGRLEKKTESWKTRKGGEWLFFFSSFRRRVVPNSFKKSEKESCIKGYETFVLSKSQCFHSRCACLAETLQKAWWHATCVVGDMDQAHTTAQRPASGGTRLSTSRFIDPTDH